MTVKPVPSQVYRQTVTDMAAAERARVVVEVGVYSGKLSRMLATLPCVEELTLVDPWHEWPGKFDQAHMDRVADEVIAWADTEDKVRVIRLPSVDAASSFGWESIDFWQTDGCHKYEMVVADIRAWWPKIKPGGIACGDNYEAPSVARAVDEILPHRKTAAKGRVWWIRK